MKDPEAVLHDLRSHQHPTPRMIADAAEAVTSTLKCDRGTVMLALMGDLESAAKLFFSFFPTWRFHIAKERDYLARIISKEMCIDDPTVPTWVVGRGGNGPSALLAMLVRIKLLEDEAYSLDQMS